MSEQKQSPQAPEATELAQESLEQVSGGVLVNGGCILVPTDPPPFFPEG